jgi:hypothetical protein
VAGPNAFVQVNVPTTTPLGKKLATYEFVDGGGDTVESEAVTLTDAAGNELLGQKPMADSVPVTLASDQTPIPIAIVPNPAGTGTLTVIPSANVPTAFLPADPTRLGFSIVNRSSTAMLYILLSAAGPISVTNFSVPLQPGAYYEDPFNYTGPVSGIWAAVNPGDQANITVYSA